MCPHVCTRVCASVCVGGMCNVRVWNFTQRRCERFIARRLADLVELDGLSERDLSVAGEVVRLEVSRSDRLHDGALGVVNQIRQA